MKKRGASFVVTLLIIMAIGLIVFFLIINFFSGKLGQQAKGIGQEIELGFGDYDGDNTADKFDSCLCLDGNVGNEGCPAGVKPQSGNLIQKYKNCPDDFCQKYGIKGCPNKPERT